VSDSSVEPWPGGQRIAVMVNVMYEQWSPGVAPGIGPMGDPLSNGVDHQAMSWGAYGVRQGIWNLLALLEEFQVRANVFASGIIGQSAPDTLRAAADAGHEICAHGWAQNMIPAGLSETQERETVARCVTELTAASGQRPAGWISPRCTPSGATAQLLAEAGFGWFGDVFDADLPYPLDTPGGTLAAVPFGLEINDLPLTIRYGRPIEDLWGAFETSLAARRELRGRALLDVTVHAHVGGRPNGLATFRKILGALTGADDCWIALRHDVAAAAATPGA
jgi:peptidoglycan/xylan/chitin deacetylase (PgdA/CDA1 family)